MSGQPAQDNQIATARNEGKLREHGCSIGLLFAGFMIKEIDAGTFDSPGASEFARRCAASVHEVQDDMRNDGFDDKDIAVVTDACLAKIKELFSTYRAGLLATPTRGRNQ